MAVGERSIFSLGVGPWEFRLSRKPGLVEESACSVADLKTLPRLSLPSIPKGYIPEYQKIVEYVGSNLPGVNPDQLGSIDQGISIPDIRRLDTDDSLKFLLGRVDNLTLENLSLRIAKDMSPAGVWVTEKLALAEKIQFSLQELLDNDKSSDKKLRK